MKKLGLGWVGGRGVSDQCECRVARCRARLHDELADVTGATNHQNLAPSVHSLSSSNGLTLFTSHLQGRPFITTTLQDKIETEDAHKER